MIKNKLLWGLLLLPGFLSARLTPEQLDSYRNRQVEAVKVNGENFTVDGNLNEPVWQTGNWQSNFIQRDPNDGSPESFKTEFCIFYDDNCLYIGARAYDPEPKKINAILSRRDTYTTSDWLYISIDSFNDNRTAFEFGINAAGVKHDLRRFDDTSADWEWDAIWEGDSKINSDNWTAEWRIPFRELRFTSSDDMIWGFQVYRELPRMNNEFSVWSYWSHKEEGFVSRYGSLVGLKNIKVENPIYVSPYIAGQSNVSQNLVTSVHEKNYDLRSNIGADVQYVTQRGLTFNATINPDFGQVEADPADFNLTEFETYFSENRPFFMEGSNILRFGLGFGDGDSQNDNLFYSRRIGRSPQGYVPEDDDKEVMTYDYPNNANIIGAAKLTGKTTSGLSIGIMEAVTNEEEGVIYYEDESKDVAIIEPLTNYWLSRFQQDFKDGQTSIGGIFTAVNRKLDDTEIDYLHRAAYTGGVDIDHEFFNRQYSFLGAFTFSNVQGDTTALQNTQTSSARYFQRVDREGYGKLNYDPLRTSLSGYSARAVVMKNAGNFRGAAGGWAFSPGFENNDMGYIQIVDNITQFVWLQYQQWEGMKHFRSIWLNFNQWASWTFNGDRKNFGGNVNFHFSYNNGWGNGFGINRNAMGLNVSANRGGPLLRTPDNLNYWVYVNTDSRKKLQFYVEGWHYLDRDKSNSYGFSPSVTWRPRQNLQFSVSTNYEKMNDTWSWIGVAELDNQDDEYIWSKMKQHTLSIVIRTDVTLTPTLSFQYYAQPFFTAGNYYDYMRVADSYAKDYNQRYEQLGDRIYYNEDWGEYIVDMNLDGDMDYSFGGNVDFNYKQFRSNLVMRWEYKTGSTLFLVWSQGFTDYEEFQPFGFNRDAKTLFNTDGDNVFMIKVSHMLNI